MAAQEGPREEEVGEATSQTGDEATAAEATAEAVTEATVTAWDKATVVAEETTKAIKVGGRALATTPTKEEVPTKDTRPSRLPKEAAEWGTMRP